MAGQKKKKKKKKKKARLSCDGRLTVETKVSKSSGWKTRKLTFHELSTQTDEGAYKLHHLSIAIESTQQQSIEAVHGCQQQQPAVQRPSGETSPVRGEQAPQLAVTGL
mgnify:CR=1 FL=1